VTYVVGDRVLVSSRGHDGHHRTPAYLKGKPGTIARVHATFTNPETRAYGDDGLPELRLYLIDFSARDVWGSGAQGGRILADVFEHWLEEAS
jgi:nitrile hydratase